MHITTGAYILNFLTAICQQCTMIFAGNFDFDRYLAFLDKICYTVYIKQNLLLNVPQKIVRSLTKSSTISSIRCFAPSTHCLLPLIITFVSVLFERGNDIDTPPNWSWISRRTVAPRITKCRCHLVATSVEISTVSF